MIYKTINHIVLYKKEISLTLVKKKKRRIDSANLGVDYRVY